MSTPAYRRTMLAFGVATAALAASAGAFAAETASRITAAEAKAEAEAKTLGLRTDATQVAELTAPKGTPATIPAKAEERKPEDRKADIKPK